MNLQQIDPELIEPQRLAECVIDVLRDERRRPRPGRSPGISNRDALLAIRYEAFLVSVAACNLGHGLPLTAEDKERLLLSWTRIDTIVSEAIV